jgi:adenylate cyclase
MSCNQADAAVSQEQEITLDSFEYVELTARSLRTVPIVLYQHAPTVFYLNLSKNPLLEIPLDFIQSCETLRELRLCHMAMKKVPQSVRHSSSLQRLDLSCNRIVDLDEAGLDLIPGLMSLKVQNNRLERLPSPFLQLNKLRFLNISNNKFDIFPRVVCEMTSLVDLDVSFNTISQLPPELGQLCKLERLVIVGNQVSEFPEQCAGLVRLSELDCRRNNITSLHIICRLPRLETLRADYNMVHAVDLSLGPSFKTLEVTNNDITRLALVPGPVRTKPFSLTHLDISHAKLSSLDDFALAALTSLTSLKLDYNSFRSLPDVLCSLAHLAHLSCTDNELDALPSDIGALQNLITLDAHNNNLTEVPRSIWNCGSLVHINMTSNLIRLWHDPPPGSENSGNGSESIQPDRKLSSSTIGTLNNMSTSHPLPPLPPPLACSLKRLYLGDNRLEDDVFHPLNLLRELAVLNLSFNQIQEIPPFWLQSLTQLEKLYLSGNKVTSLPSENLYRLTKLTVLFLNGNKLQTLPAELGKVKSLAVLDVGSNVLKYNVNNWEFDWNWYMQLYLRLLNRLSMWRVGISTRSCVT